MKFKNILIISLAMFLCATAFSLYAAEPTHFTGFKLTPTSCNYAGKVSINCINAVDEEDEVGVFVHNDTGDEILVGACVMGDVVEEHYFVTVYGDDSSTEEKDGAKEGDELIFKVWDKSEEREGIISYAFMSSFPDADGLLLPPSVPPIWVANSTFGLLNFHAVLKNSCNYAGKVTINGKNAVDGEDEVRGFIRDEDGCEIQVGDCVIGDFIPGHYLISVFYKNGVNYGDELIFKVWDKSEDKTYIIPSFFMTFESNNYCFIQPSIPPVWMLRTTFGLLNLSAIIPDNQTESCKLSSHYAGKVTINGINAVDGEDEVRVFAYNDTDGEIQVGTGIIGDMFEGHYFVTVYGDEPETTEKNGAKDDDKLIFKIWDKSENKTYIIPSDTATEEILTCPPVSPVWKKETISVFLNLCARNPCKENLIGDINQDCQINLTDAILGLQIISGILPSECVYKESDVNNDNRIGIEEVVYILQYLLKIKPI